MQTADVAEINRVLETFPEGAPRGWQRSPRRRAIRLFHAANDRPLLGKEMPRASDFRQVPCHDISAGGMSFYWDRQLDFEYLVVALESSTASLRLIGRTTFCVAEGERRYRIGCQFVKRLK